ncbi:glycosyltransferase family 2 protein [Halopenitus persicus]|uniref:Glycosyl transferase family 2 n=1 Tax=Halopenitus persicus TaxID=1048396 RepID=A0A1H3MFM5_9EURY|nr:glycosyltransferase family 2 protein [Halopenitus persicus]SDY74939.1 Glycosyl transferase family 2 [Halopenitus persicus]
MKVSLITPVYNDPRIERCLKSIHEQEGKFELEHVIVDSNSTDQTVEILDAHRDDIDILIREDDDGVYDAMNKGVRAATGDIIGILNSDDRYQNQTVLESVHRTMKETESRACYGDLVYVGEDDSVVRYWEGGEYEPWKFYLGWMPPHPTFFVHRSVYEEIGYFNQQLSIAADYEFMLRALALHDISVSYINDVLVRMEIGGQSNESVASMVEAVSDMYEAWQYHGKMGRFVAPFLHPLEKVPQYFRKPPKDDV